MQNQRNRGAGSKVSRPPSSSSRRPRPRGAARAPASWGSPEPRRGVAEVRGSWGFTLGYPRRRRRRGRGGTAVNRGVGDGDGGAARTSRRARSPRGRGVRRLDLVEQGRRGVGSAVVGSVWLGEAGRRRRGSTPSSAGVNGSAARGGNGTGSRERGLGFGREVPSSF